jgi:hypothetical protein
MMRSNDDTYKVVLVWWAQHSSINGLLLSSTIWHYPSTETKLFKKKYRNKVHINIGHVWKEVLALVCTPSVLKYLHPLTSTEHV